MSPLRPCRSVCCSMWEKVLPESATGVFLGWGVGSLFRRRRGSLTRRGGRRRRRRRRRIPHRIASQAMGCPAPPSARVRQVGAGVETARARRLARPMRTLRCTCSPGRRSRAPRSIAPLRGRWLGALPLGRLRALRCAGDAPHPAMLRIAVRCAKRATRSVARRTRCAREATHDARCAMREAMRDHHRRWRWRCAVPRWHTCSAR